jgi:hypothetical protein
MCKKVKGRDEQMWTAPNNADLPNLPYFENASDKAVVDKA